MLQAILQPFILSRVKGIFYQDEKYFFNFFLGGIFDRRFSAYRFLL
jgi:hypothetical protein